MSFNFNSQINKEENTTKYSIQIETDNKEQYLFMQEMARECIDGKHKQIGNEEYLKELQDALKKFSYVGSEQFLSDSTLQNIPNCCRACPNHPSNGGSGICNCTAPYFEQGITVTCTTTASNSSVMVDQK